MVGFNNNVGLRGAAGVNPPVVRDWNAYHQVRNAVLDLQGEARGRTLSQDPALLAVRDLGYEATESLAQKLAYQAGENPGVLRGGSARDFVVKSLTPPEPKLDAGRGLVRTGFTEATRDQAVQLEAGATEGVASVALANRSHPNGQLKRVKVNPQGPTRLSCKADRGDALAVVCFDKNGATLDGVGLRLKAGSRVSTQDPANLGYHADAMED